jgi:hypothetical protein
LARRTATAAAAPEHSSLVQRREFDGFLIRDRLAAILNEFS